MAQSKGQMTVREAGKKGGQRVKQLVSEGKQTASTRGKNR